MGGAGVGFSSAAGAAEQPLLVIAEDVHQLDGATVEILRFLARRLEHDPIVPLATARDDVPDPLDGAAVRVLDLGPLGAGGSRQLLERVAPDLTRAAQAGILRTVAAAHPATARRLRGTRVSSRTARSPSGSTSRTAPSPAICTASSPSWASPAARS